MISTNQQNPQAVTAVKGHLVTKSSALATDSCKLEKQFLTAQNMASHYKRVLNAKPTLDLSPPKSLLASQKARDRAKREMAKHSAANRSIDRPKSVDVSRDIFEERATEIRPTSSTFPQQRGLVNQQQNTPKPLPDRLKLNKSMANMMDNFTKKSASSRTMLYKPSSARSSQHFDDMNSEQVSPMASSRHNLNQNEKRTKLMLTSLSFNSLNANKNDQIPHPALKAMSRLVAGHNYDVMDYHSDKFKTPDEEFQPRIVNKGDSQSKLLKSSSCYQPPLRRKKPKPQQQPQQSARESIPEDENLNKSNTSKQENKNDRDNEILNKSLNNSAINESKSQSLKRAAEKEEDIKYLSFIKDVTDDIITRGICSNRVINNCFEEHIKKNRGVLNEKKMRELLDTLRKDIGIPVEDELDVNEKYHQTINKAILMDQKRNTENPDSTNLVGAEYLTLRKFGWSKEDAKPKKADSNSSFMRSNEPSQSRGNVWQMIDDELETNKNSSPKHHSTDLYEDYENQIMRNIQSIRRKSLQDEDKENFDVSGHLFETSSRKLSNDQTPKSSSPTRHASILKKTSNLDLDNLENFGKSAMENNNNNTASSPSDEIPKLKHDELRHVHHTDHPKFGDDDDDDLIVMADRRHRLNHAPQQHQQQQPAAASSSILHESQHEMPLDAAHNPNNTNKTSERRLNLDKNEYSDEILFKDDYGDDGSESESHDVDEKNHHHHHHQQQQQHHNTSSIRKYSSGEESNFESDEDDHTKGHGSFIKNNPIKKIESHKTHKSEDESDDGEINFRNESTANETPKPAPRTSGIQNQTHQKNNRHNSEDDDDDYEDDH